MITGEGSQETSAILASAGLIPSQLNPTFLHMEQRKWNRQKFGQYRDESPAWRKSIVLLFCIGLILFLSNRIYEKVVNEIEFSVRESFVVFLLFLVLLSLALKPQRIVYALTVVFIFLLILCALTYPQETAAYVAPISLFVLAICFMIHIVYYYIFPWIVSQSGFCFALHRIQTDSRKRRSSSTNLSDGAVTEVRFEYHKKLRYFRSLLCLGGNQRFNSTFSYNGQWTNGKPHGWGIWRDDSSIGERLIGYWYNGIPLGPFRSFETATANSFSCISMLMCSARKSGLYCLASREVTTDIEYEAVTIECSISGGFYKNFPAVYKIPSAKKIVQYPPLQKDDQVPPMSIETSGKQGLVDILPQLRHIDEDRPVTSVLVTATSDGIYVNGHRPNSEGSSVNIELNREDEEMQGDGLYQTLQPHSSIRSSLNVVNWDIRENREALIFIHGYNISVDHAAKKLAQLIASGNFPSYIVPVVYSWPTGRTLFYFDSLATIEHSAVITSLGRLLSALYQGGITKVHFMTHSMGIRILLIALQHENFRNLLYTRKHQTNIQLRREEQIVDSIQEQHQIEEEEIESKQTQEKPAMKILSTTFLNPDYPLVPFRDEAYHQLHAVCSHITVYVDKTDEALGYQSFLSRETSIGLINESFRSGSSPNDEILDLDMICVTNLRHNIHSLRHAAFNVNRSLLEDIREVIVSRKRAWNRDDRLIHQEGNFYSFISTPSSVTSDHIA